MKNKILLTAVLISIMPALLNANSKPTVENISKMLMCTCGCSMVLFSCQCGTADKMQSEISGMIEAGKSEKEILAYFVSKYGEKILAAPTKSGFNLTAWITPVASILVAASLIVTFLFIWYKKRASMRMREIEVKEEDTPYFEKLEDELKKFD